MTLRKFALSVAVVLLAHVPGFAQKVQHDPEPIRLKLTVEGPIRHGETLRISVEPESDVRLESVMFMAPGLATFVVDDTPPFETETVLPRRAVGMAHFAAIGKREGGIVCCNSDSVLLPIESSIQFVRLNLYQDFVRLDRVGDTEMVPVWGELSDDPSDVINLHPTERMRENWLHTVPIEYESRDPEVVSVSEYGEILALNPGETTIDIRLQGMEASVPVFVRTRNKAPIPDVGPETRCVSAGTWLKVQGTVEDPDDGPGPLEYGWGWNTREYELEFEGAKTLTLSGIVPDYPDFVLFLNAKDGADHVHDFVQILVDQDLDGKCKAGYQKFLDVEPFVLPPDRDED